MNLDEISQGILGATRKVVLSSSKLPNPGTEYSLNLSVPAVRNNLDAKRGQVLSLIEKMFGFLNVKVPLSSFVDSNQWQDDADVEDFLDVLVDANDQIFEHVGESLDTAAGLKKDMPELVIVGTSRSRFKKQTTPAGKSEGGNNESPDVFRLIAARVVERPQLKFPDKIDNSNSVFVPKLTHKPHALRPLDESMIRLDDGEGSYQNPYSFELQSFVVDDEFLTPSTFGPPKPLEDTPLIFVDSPDSFESMMKDLSVKSEIAVDLEHHSYRTFQGFTCLMQISTREKDYVIDVLALRGHIHELNQIFANPNVLKVFHGADSDISWLQRDFGVYVVNMFDTFRASKALGLPKLSLAYLLDRYLHIDLDKRFQLADWRIRPLPEELIRYARSDTHYLLHVCDLIKNDLIERAKYESSSDQYCVVRRVFDESTIVCSSHYERPIHTDDSHLELYERSRKVFNSQQLMALKLLHAWRDKIARREDESTGYVLPNHMLLQMAELLPKEPTGVLACCQPIPPLVKQNVHEMHGFILQARRQPLQQVENPSAAAAKAHLVSLQKFSPELEALSCPLDRNAKLPGERLGPNIVVEIMSPKKSKASSLSSSFVGLLIPNSKKVFSDAKGAMMGKVMTLFAGYAVRSQSLPKSGPIATATSSTPEPTTPKMRPPTKRSASAAVSGNANLHLQPLPASSSPAKRTRRAAAAAQSLTPLVLPTVTRKRRKNGPKFVENVIVLSDNEEGNGGAGNGSRHEKRQGRDKHARRKEYHEKKGRQMQAFSSSKSPKSGGK